jgi:hypothetical protein
MVPVAEIEKNDFNLNLPRYIDTSEPEDLQDIEGHLRGGIPDRDLDALARLLAGAARRARPNWKPPSPGLASWKRNTAAKTPRFRASTASARQR